jgi:YD repeat-containing protein
MYNVLRAVKYLLFCIGCLLFYSKSNAQEKYQAAKVVPPSPTAASLSKYGEFPVSYYSGTADVTIPLYEIKTSNHTLPIVLKYANNGIKVGENASWVGLGWSLSAGGVITKTTIGKDDFNGNGYYTAPTLPPNNGSEYYPGSSWSSDKQYFDNIYNGYLDGEPDIFHYNFGNYSGKFVMGKKADGSIIFMDERNNLKVEYITPGNNWRITDGNGYKYYFNTKESATDYSYSSSTSQLPDNAPLSAYTRVIQADVTTGWYIDSIVAPTTEVIKFEYERKSNSLSIAAKAEKVFNLLALSGGCSGTPNATYKYYTSSRQIIYDLYLKRVTFEQGAIEFNTTDREDIEYVDANKPDKLSEVVIKDLSNKVIKRYRLSHNYFNGGADRRLRLDSLFEYGGDGAAKPPYVFSYFSPGSIPPKYSGSQIDYWGFRNNNIYPGLVPAITLPAYERVLEGADREADTTLGNVKAGVLSSLTYPTGGSTSFDYEMNSYSNLRGDDRYIKSPAGRTVYAYDFDASSHATDTFTVPITDTIPVRISFSYSKFDPNAPDLINENLQVVYAYIYKDGQYLASYSNFDTYPYYTLVLKPGRYTINVRHIQGYITNMYANWEKKIPIREKKGGGLRIKTITNYANGVQTGMKKFLYTLADSSSGRLITKPVNSYIIDFIGGSDFGCEYYATVIGRESGTIYPTGLSSGSCIVGYDKVTELTGENGEGGKVEYYYGNYEDSYTGTPFVPAYHSPFNGKLITSVVFNAAGDTLKRTDNTYLAKEIYALTGLKLYRNDEFSAPSPTTVAEMFYKIRYYTQESRWFPLQSEITTEYGAAGKLVTMKTFNYENFDNKEVTLMELSQSDGKIFTTKYKYPSDYTTAGTGSFAYQMKQQHIVSPLVEQLTFVTTGSTKKLVGGTFTEFKSYNNAYQPGTIYKIEANQPLSDITESSIAADNQIHLHVSYKPDAYFDRYNNLGNIEQYRQIDNVPHAYIWGYKNGLPIAKVDNAAVADVAYTSFEADATGNWTINAAARDLSAAVTGRQSFNMASGAITKGGLSASNKYVVSYWTKNASPFAITGTQGAALKGKTFNGWTYYQHEISGQSTVTITGSGLIDELRLCPANAQMSSYTYEPLVGMTSESDFSGKITYYEYDGFNQLKLIRDNDGKILKQYDYQYQKPATH